MTDKLRKILFFSIIGLGIFVGFMTKAQTMNPLEQWLMTGSGNNRLIRPVSTSTTVIVGGTATSTTSTLQVATGTLTVRTLASCNTVDTNASGTFICGTDEGGAGSGITTLNGLTTSTQTFATSTGGSVFDVTSAGSIHTFQFPISPTFSNVTVTGTLNVAGVQNNSSTLTVQGVTELRSTLNAITAILTTLLSSDSINATTSLISQGTTRSVGAITASSTLTLEGAAALRSTLNVAGAVNNSSTLTNEGATVLRSTLNVTGAQNNSSTLTIEGATVLRNALTQLGGLVSLASTTINGHVTSTSATVTGITSALGLYGSGGLLGEYAGSACSGSDQVSSIDAAGVVTCSAQGSGGGGSVSTSSAITVNHFPFWVTASGGLAGTSTLTTSGGNINASGTITTNGVQVSTSTRANPSVTIGLSANNGTANTFLSSDASPALSQAIAPTWTQKHIYQSGVDMQATATFSGTPAQTTSTGMVNFGATPQNLANASGTYISGNSASGYSGDFINLQNNSSTILRVASSGATTIGNSTTTFSVFANGHINSSGTTPQVSSCGTSPSILGTDRWGVITVGSVSATGCTLTFASSYVNAPMCHVTNRNSSVVNAMTYAVTTTTLTVSQTGLTSNVLDYSCGALE